MGPEAEAAEEQGWGGRGSFASPSLGGGCFGGKGQWVLGTGSSAQSLTARAQQDPMCVSTETVQDVSNSAPLTPRPSFLQPFPFLAPNDEAQSPGDHPEDIIYSMYHYQPCLI